MSVSLTLGGLRAGILPRTTRAWHAREPWCFSMQIAHLQRDARKYYSPNGALMLAAFWDFCRFFGLAGVAIGDGSLCQPCRGCRMRAFTPPVPSASRCGCLLREVDCIWAVSGRLLCKVGDYFAKWTASGPPWAAYFAMWVPTSRSGLSLSRSIAATLPGRYHIFLPLPHFPSRAAFPT